MLDIAVVNDELFLLKLGENIKRIRMEKGLSLMQLADLCNSKKSIILRLEKGGNPTALTLKNIADGLEISLDELFDFYKKD